MKRVLSYIWDYLNQDVYVHHKLNFVPNVVMNLIVVVFVASVIIAVLKYFITIIV